MLASLIPERHIMGLLSVDLVADRRGHNCLKFNVDSLGDGVADQLSANAEQSHTKFCPMRYSEGLSDRSTACRRLTEPFRRLWRKRQWESARTNAGKKILTRKRSPAISLE